MSNEYRSKTLRVILWLVTNKTHNTNICFTFYKRMFVKCKTYICIIKNGSLVQTTSGKKQEKEYYRPVAVVE